MSARPGGSIPYEYAPNRIGGDQLPLLRRAAGRHNIVCIEADCPGVFEITCSCGQQSWTPWGRAHAEECARVHLWAVGAPVQRVIR
jgi:hypothetical protein